MARAEMIADMLAQLLPGRRIVYSCQDFDVAQHIAEMLTDADRAAGIADAPRVGHSGANWTAAHAAVRAWLRAA